IILTRPHPYEGNIPPRRPGRSPDLGALGKPPHLCGPLTTATIAFSRAPGRTNSAHLTEISQITFDAQVVSSYGLLRRGEVFGFDRFNVGAGFTVRPVVDRFA